MNTTVKRIPVNTTVSYESLVTLCTRITSIDKSQIAELWVLGNKVITELQRCSLLKTVYFKRAICYAQLCRDNVVKNIPNMSEVNKAKFFNGVKELKVG